MRITQGVLVAAILGSTACTSPDESSGDMHLELVQAPLTATPGSSAFQAILVKVVNGDGTAAPGVPVAWSIMSGGGLLSVSADTSGIDGLAAAQWTPGLVAGPQEIGAYIYDEKALTITVNAEAFHADKLSTNFERGCGLSGTAVWCWRDDYPAQPIRRIMPQFESHDIAASYWFACVLDAEGTAYCNRAFEDLDPQAYSGVPGLPPLRSLTAGTRYFCGVALADDTPWCWEAFGMVPVHVSPSPALSRLSTGGRYSCGLDAAGAAWCWRLPLGSPTLIPGGHAFQSVSAHDEHDAACGIEGSDLWCWFGSETPLRVAGVSAGQVALGWPFTLLNAGPVAMVGDVRTNFGLTAITLGIDIYQNRDFPLPVRQVYPTCLLTYDNAAYCLTTADINADVYPLPSYWKAVPAPPP